MPAVARLLIQTVRDYDIREHPIAFKVNVQTWSCESSKIIPLTCQNRLLQRLHLRASCVWLREGMELIRSKSWVRFWV